MSKTVKDSKTISDIITVKEGSRVRVEFTDEKAVYFSYDYFNNACSRIGTSVQGIIANPAGFAIKGDFIAFKEGEDYTDKDGNVLGQYKESGYNVNQLRVVLSQAGAMNASIGMNVALAMGLVPGNTAASTTVEEKKEEKEKEPIVEDIIVEDEE